MEPISHLLNTSISGIAILGGVAAAAWRAVSSLPQRAWSWFLNSQTSTVQIVSEDKLFEALRLWMADLPSVQHSRRLLAVSGSSRASAGLEPCGSPPNEKAPEPSVRLVFAPGSHWFVHNGTIVWIDYSRDEAKAGQSAWRETVTLRVLTRKRERLARIIDEIQATIKTDNERRIYISMSQTDWWNNLYSTKGRASESVILPNRMWEDIYEDAIAFYDREAWYHGVGIPWRRGYVFGGVPGSGKSSAALALATALGVDLHILNLGDTTLTDASLAQLFARASARSLILVEDIDTAFDGRDSSSPSKLTFGGLLNALDSAYASEGRIVIMTTNHLAKLDPALIRPGRADRHFEFRYADDTQIRRLADRLGVKDIPSFAAQVTMAQVQEALVQLVPYLSGQCVAEQVVSVPVNLRV